ncbi:hypothetical protein NC652_014503 [Populus alba x Populus x berolinensis]|nr:hypothetical protein NC652_014503 [Populus alba x Populus x berolinensis]
MLYLSFGGGPRLCAGNHLAKLNIFIFIHYVVTLYNWSLLCPDEQITMDPLPFPSHGMPIKVSKKSFFRVEPTAGFRYFAHKCSILQRIMSYKLGFTFYSIMRGLILRWISHLQSYI